MRVGKERPIASHEPPKIKYDEHIQALSKVQDPFLFFCTAAHRFAQACHRAEHYMPPHGHPQHVTLALRCLS
jgi:hypothetical protein